ncbi:MAG: hypothetical protein HOI01_00130 [Proteobacteria bacterium]|nr:hypothetical protein [Pseudomonadota bacterium]
MRPGPFDYYEPENIAQALDLIAEATVIAGGQSLIPSMRLRQVTVTKLISISNIAELSGDIIKKADSIEIGALTTLSDLLSSQIIEEHTPWLREAAQQVGDVQVRNLATVVGNICWSDPRANMSIALLASNAIITTINSKLQERKISLKDFFVSFQKNILENELVKNILIPNHELAAGRYLEFSRQRNDLALVNVSVVSSEKKTTLVIGGTRNVPLIIETDEHNKMNHAATIMNKIPDRLNDFHTDQYGSQQYRLELAISLARRVLNSLRCKLDE